MREILFRGKDTDNGEWIYGAYSYHDIWNRGFLVNVGIDNVGPIAWTREVQPETVGQFTGFTDRNGTKIFEGDFIRTCYTSPCIMNSTYEVKFVNDRGGWYPFANGDGCGCCEDDTYPPTDDGRVDIFVVIGNIHDNPEL